MRQSHRASASARSLDEACATLADRLRARFPEIEASLSALIDAISAPREDPDPIYLDSLHGVRTAILAYAADVIEHGERRAADVPPAVRAAARLAARSGVALDTVLRRYSAGNAFVGDILLEEAERAQLTPAALRRVLHRQATLFNHLLEAVTEEHVREAESRGNGSGAWRRSYIEGLLVGRLPNRGVDLDYDLDGHHIGLMASGEGAHEAMRELARRLGRRLLAGSFGEESAWACWLGGTSPLEIEQALQALAEIGPEGLSVGIGEPGEGVSGWRLSHRQAKAALPIAQRRGERVVRYADVAVLASVLHDDLATISLRRLYLEPLESGRDGGKVARETLRAYFAAERNVSSTAAALGVDRRTVTNRIRAVEELFGRPIGDFAADLEIALRLAD